MPKMSKRPEEWGFIAKCAKDSKLRDFHVCHVLQKNALLSIKRGLK